MELRIGMFMLVSIVHCSGKLDVSPSCNKDSILLS